MEFPRTDPDDAKDAELAELILGGDRAAAETLVRRHWEELFSVAHLIVRDIAAAEDVTQEALAAALGALDSFDPSRPIRPWLAGIVSNRAIDWTRRRARLGEVELDAASKDDLEVSDQPGSERGDLRAALEELDPEDRALLVLRHVLDYRSPEIAELLGLSPEGVRSRLKRTRDRLKTTLTTEAP